MATYPKAVQRNLGGRPEPRLARKNKLIFHTMVGSLDGTDQYFREINGPGFEGTESHFGTDETRVYQWQDTNFQADAQLEGNDDCVSVETADHGGSYPEWSGSDVPSWSDEHLEINAQLGAWVCTTHNIPPVLIEDTQDSTRGIGFHRDGVDPWREEGDERYSNAYGKVCPGDRRYAQRHKLVARIREIMEGETMTTDEFVKLLESGDVRVALRDALFGENHFLKYVLLSNDVRGTGPKNLGWFLRAIDARTHVILEALQEFEGVDTEKLAEKINRLDAELVADAVADEQAERMTE